MRAAILAVLVMLGGCYDPVADSTVLLMGDSIAQEMTDELSFELHTRDNAPILIVNGVAGMTASFDYSGEYWAGRISQANADTIFISLGTNDAGAADGRGLDLSGFESAATLILDAAGGAEVFWLLPSSSSGRPLMLEVRGMIEEAVALYPNAAVVEVGEDRHEQDNVHLSAKGEHDMARRFIRLLGYEA